MLLIVVAVYTITSSGLGLESVQLEGFGKVGREPVQKKPPDRIREHFAEENAQVWRTLNS